MHRRSFWWAAGGGVGLPFALPAQRSPDRGPPIAGELVKEFVVAAHSKLDRTQELLARDVQLIHATWDWGGGDFETGLGGAAHMGNREIARFLLEQGARMDLFAAAMLGELAVVKAAITAFPNLKDVLGPHKIPLVAHAKRGGAAAEPVVAYLESLK